MRYLALALPLLTACGDDSSSSAPSQVPAPTTPTSTSFQATALTDLPVCDAARKGNIAYVSAEKKLYACDGSWTAVGTVGTTTVERVKCKGSDIVSGIGYMYDYIRISTGDIFVTATILDSTRGYSNSAYYSAAVAESELGKVRRVVVAADTKGAPTSGFWTFDAVPFPNLKDASLKVTYSDAEFTPADTLYTRNDDCEYASQ